MLQTTKIIPPGIFSSRQSVFRYSMCYNISVDHFSVKNLVWLGLCGVLTLLVGMNAFFIRGLVTRVEGISDIQVRLSVLETKFDLMMKKLE